MLHRCGRLLPLLMACLPVRGAGQAAPEHLDFAIGAIITNIIPGTHTSAAANQIGDLVFLRLGRYGGTSFGDRAAVPELASSWTRRDSVTIAFDLDPRARWHDGVPVTSRDVVFSFDRARNPRTTPLLASQLVDVAGVEAEGDRRVVVRFTRPYGEQLYDATYLVQILPAHLLSSVHPDSVTSSAFARAPVGTGPYRWDRLEAADYVRLVAVKDFFLGTPAITQLTWRFTNTQDTRLGMLFAGEVQVVEDLIPPVSNIDRLKTRPDLRLAQLPSMAVSYLLFNQRANGDTTRPNPFFADAEVRRAVTMAIDRKTLTTALLGKYARPASSPAPAGAWYGALAPDPVKYDPAEAARILKARGWTDSDGDGVIDRNGLAFAFTIVLPSSSVVRMQVAQIIAQQLKQVGITVEIQPVDNAQYPVRRKPGNFDAILEGFSPEPSPWSMLTRWGCGEGTNFGRYCNRGADSLLRAVHLARKDPGTPLRAWLNTIAADFPAAFLYTPDRVVTLPAGYRNVTFHVESPWLMIWTWTLAGAGR